MRINLNFLAVVSFCFLFCLSFVWAPLAVFRDSVQLYLHAIFWPMALGWLLGGVLDHYVPKEYVSKILSADKKRSIFLSVLLGFLMSACSHGILALSIELNKKGASNPVTVSFLLASPWANLPITLILFGFFGLKALYIILGALLVACTTGLIFQQLDRLGWIEKNTHTARVAADFSIRKDLARRLRQRKFTWISAKRDLAGILQGAGSLIRMTGGWVLLGIGLSGLAAAFIPPEIFRRYMGPSVFGLSATLALATVLEVCSEGTAPLSFEIFRQTGAFGNAFVFLMAGVVTDFTEIAMIWANLGRRTALWIPAVAIPQILALGLIANQLFR